MATKTEKDERNIHQRLLDVMRECTYVRKDNKKGVPFPIVNHDAVTAKVRPYLVKHGIRYESTVLEHGQDGNRTWVRMRTTFINVDKPEDVVEVETFGYGIDSQDKGPGKAMSYAVKYALLKTLGLETGEDPDTEMIEYDSDPDVKTQPSPDDFIEPTPEQEQQYQGSVDRVCKDGLNQLCDERGASPKQMREWIAANFDKRFESMTSAEKTLCLQRAKNEFMTGAPNGKVVEGVA